MYLRFCLFNLNFRYMATRMQTDRQTHRHTYTCILQCSPTSVGLAQAHPINYKYLPFDLWPYTGTTGSMMALSLVDSTTPVRGASHTSFQSVSTIFLALTRHVAPLPIHQSAVSSVRLATLRASPMTCILGSLPTLWVRMWRIFRLRLWPMGLWKLLLKCILTSSPTNQVSVDMKLVLIVIILLSL